MKKTELGQSPDFMSWGECPSKTHTVNKWINYEITHTFINSWLKQLIGYPKIYKVTEIRAYRECITCGAMQNKYVSSIKTPGVGPIKADSTGMEIGVKP